MAKKASSNCPAANPAMPPIAHGQCVTRNAQVALRQAQRARGVIVLGNGKKRVADQRPPVEKLQPRENCHARHQRQPEFLVERPTFGDWQEPRKRLRLRAPFDRGHLLDHQRQRERREHVEMLVQLRQYRPHRDDLGNDADRRAHRQRQQKSEDGGQAHPQDEQRAEHAAEHADLPRREAHHPRGRVHRVVDDADQRVDGADRQPRGDDRCEHPVS